MTEAKTELAHLVTLLDPPSAMWTDYAKWKAAALARKYPQTYADLPRLLELELRVKATCTTSTDAP